MHHAVLDLARPGRIAGTIVLALALRLTLLAVLAAPHGGLAEAMCQFDCGWYERIALAGYGADPDWPGHGGEVHFVFFPLYPALLALAGEMLPIRLAGILLSAGCLGGFIGLGLAHLRATRRRVAPLTWIVIVTFFPTGLFFTAVYTEALFALLATACLAATAARRPWLAAACAALASATRPTGILLSAIVAVNAVVRCRRARSLTPAPIIAAFGPVALAPLGLILFSAVQWWAVGDPLAFSHQQRFWDRHWIGPLSSIAHGFAAVDLGNLPARPSHSAEALFALLGLGVAAIQAIRGRFAEAWLLAACILLPAATGLDSMPRYVGTNPAFLLALHDLLAGTRRGAILACGMCALAFAACAEGWMSGATSLF